MNHSNLLPDLDIWLGYDDGELTTLWTRLTDWAKGRFGDNIGIEGLLFLIGVRESGSGYHPKMKKERKQEKIMLGTAHAFESLGLYTRKSQDQTEVAWQSTVPIPKLPIPEQEKLIRLAILEYFCPLIETLPDIIVAADRPE